MDLDSAMRKFLLSCTPHFNDPLRDLDEIVKINYPLIWTGPEGQDIADTFTFTEEKQGTLQAHTSKFEQCIQPFSNFRVARYRLLGCSQQPCEAGDI